MKKLFIAAVVVLGVSAMTSCKKDYTCTYDVGGVEQVTEYEGLSKTEAEAAETTCNLASGTWAAK